MLNRFIIFLLFFVPFLYNNTVTAQDTIVIDRVIAVVGSKIILESDVENQYMQMKARGFDSEKDPKCYIFEDMLFQKLLLNQAELDSVEVSEKEVNAELNNRMQVFIEQAGGEQALEEYFGKPIIQIKDDFRDVVRDQILTQKMQRNITSDIKITPSEVQKYYDALPKDSLPLVDAQTELQHIVIYPKVTEAERKMVTDKLEDIKKQIKAGKKFATMAVLYSEDPGSASKGGELGFMARAELVPEFSAVAFTLKPGEISDVFETEYGFHILEVIERKGDKVNVRHILIKPKVSLEARQKARATLDSIARAIRIDSISFEKAATFFSEDKETLNNGGIWTNPYTGTTKFEEKYIDAATNYVIKNLKEGVVSDAYEGYDLKGKSAYKIIKVKSRSQPHVANLKDDYQTIQEMALNKKKQEAMTKWVRNKQRDSFISVSPAYHNCDFKYPGWVK